VTWVWQEMEASDLAAEVRISKGTLTGVLNTLESRGLILKKQRETDGRRVAISLTSNGKKLMKKIFPEFNQEEMKMLSALSSSEVKGLADSLHSVVKNIQSLK